MESTRIQDGARSNKDNEHAIGCFTLRTKLLGIIFVVVVFNAVWLVVFFYSRLLVRPAKANTSVDLPARRAARGEGIPLFIRARQKPVELKPVAGLADTVTDEQLVKALCSAVPMWHPPTVPSLIHELKLWGRNSDFTKPMIEHPWSGAMMVETLLSDKLCRERTTPLGASFLLDTPFGINVVLSGTMDDVEGRAEGHYGQLLMVLGEAGVSLDTPITTVSGRSGTVADLLQDAVMRFRWTRELEFIGCALALWLPPETTWTDQFGNRYSFDELIEHLVSIPHGKGPCGGCHVPYAVVTILNVDRQYSLLSASVRQKALQWLTDLSAELEKTQLAEGGWDISWPEQHTIERVYGDPILDRITIIGHHLEWIAFAPESVRPSKPTITRAVAVLPRSIDSLPCVKGRLFKVILPCSHAARALCLFRAQQPFVVWKTYWDQGRLAYDPSRGWELQPIKTKK